jgi:hypothetical protein
MSFLGGLFKAPKTKAKLQPWQEESTKSVSNTVPQILNQEFHPYTEQMTPDFDPAQQETMGQLDTLIGDSGWKDDRLASSEKYRNDLDAYRYAAANRAMAYTQQQDDARANMANSFGDDRSQVQGAERAGQLANTYAQIAGEDWNTAMGYSGQDINDRLQNNQQIASYLDQKFGQGTARRAAEQEKLTAAMNEWMRGDLDDERRALLAAQINQMLPQGYTTQTSGGIGNQLVGAAPMGLGAWLGA